MTENDPGSKPEHDTGEPTPPNPWRATGDQTAPASAAPAAEAWRRPIGQPAQPEPPAQPESPSAPDSTPTYSSHTVYGTAQPGERVLFGSAFADQPGSQPGFDPASHGVDPRLGIPGYQQAGDARTATATGPASADAPKRRGVGGVVAGVTVLALVVGGAAGAVGGYLVGDSNSSGSSANALNTPAARQVTDTPAPAGSIEAVAQKVLPTVVQLRVQGRTVSGEGSGFVISGDGLIVTNNHVVEEAADGGTITAVFADGRSAKATVVGRDPTSDVAVVKAQGVSGLPTAELGSSDDMRVGQAVVAVGSPFDLAGTVTSGIVSSLHRPTRAGGAEGDQTTVLDAIQTDAAINPGNSGGPLVNMQGQVIGINSAIYSPTSSNTAQGGSVGIGFAIPIDQARRTADEIVKTGKATQTVLGVRVQNDPQGARIIEVTAGGAGEGAGIKAGDVVTKMDDRRTETSDALVAAVRSHAPGDKVRLELSTGSTVDVTLAGQPVETG